jgi:hypothetical protein
MRGDFVFFFFIIQAAIFWHFYCLPQTSVTVKTLYAICPKICENIKETIDDIIFLLYFVKSSFFGVNMNIKYGNKISIDEFNFLRKAVGWNEKRIVAVALLTIVLVTGLWANENQIGDYTVDVGVGFLYPFVKDDNVGIDILVSLLLSSFSIGGGYYFDVVENVFSPGIYGDIHVSFLPLLLDEEDENKDEGSFSQLGIRLANQFKIDVFEILPFYGINCMFGNTMDTHILNVFGISLAYGRLGLEYSYQIPFKKMANDDISSIHRIVFKFNLKKLFE